MTTRLHRIDPKHFEPRITNNLAGLFDPLSSNPRAQAPVIVASLDMESGAALRASRISAFLSIKYWSTGAIFEYLSDCAAAFGTRKPMLITSTKAMILIIISLVLSLAAALIARCPFAVAARSPL
jgi:hypothetical protein